MNGGFMWFTREAKGGEPTPEWARRAVIDVSDEEVFFPLGCLDDEKPAIYRAGWRPNVDWIARDGHFYLPVSYLIEAYPVDAPLLTFVRDRMREMLRKVQAEGMKPGDPPPDQGRRFDAAPTVENR